MLIPIEKYWADRAPRWQAKLAAGGKFSIDERHEFEDSMSAWVDFGCSAAEKWTAKDASRFKQEWQRHLRSWERKEKRGEPFTLEEHREQQIGLGMWWQIGYAESADWNEAAWERFRRAAVSFSKADAKLMAANGQKQRDGTQSKASKQLCVQIRVDYLDRPLRNRQLGKFQHGAWRRHGELKQKRFEAAQRKLEEGAANRIVPWMKLLPEDYNFNWAKKQPDRELQLGVIYEYARESRKLRGLLARGVISNAGNTRGGTPTACGSFDGLDDYEAQASPLGRWFLVLVILADELVNNMPFAFVKVERIEQALYHTCIAPDGKTQRLWCRLDDEATGYFWYHPPVSLALDCNAAEVTDWGVYSRCSPTTGEVLPDNSIHPKRGRAWISDSARGDYGENLVISLNWKQCANSELVESFARFVATHRPTVKFPEPKPRKRQGKSAINRRSLYASLDGLAVMRLLTGSRNEDVAHATFKGIGANPKRRGQFKILGQNARNEFRDLFPFGEDPANHGDWK